jgi:hypothetical protein
VLLPRHRARHARPRRRATSRHLHAPAMQHHLHVRRTPSSPSPALIRCELHTEDFPSPFHSLRAASFLCSLRARDQPSSTEPYHCALSARATAPRAPPPPSSPEPTTLSSSRDAEESYRSCAAAAKSLRDVCTTPSTAPVLLRPRLHHPEHRPDAGRLPTPTTSRLATPSAPIPSGRPPTAVEQPPR